MQRELTGSRKWKNGEEEMVERERTEKDSERGVVKAGLELAVTASFGFLSLTASLGRIF